MTVTIILILDIVSFTVKVVKDIFPHQDYNISARVDQKVLEFYDYDVALILLETDVKISFQAR